MSARVTIEDGNPIWLSNAIIPSRDLVVSAAIPPSVAAISVNSQDVFVYVKVANPGMDDLGVCACTKAGLWLDPVPFDNVYGGVGPLVQPNPKPGGVGTIRINPASGDVLQLGSMMIALGPATQSRAWDWSPDGKFLGYVRRLGMGTGPNGARDWRLSVIALQSFTRGNGTAVAPGGVIVSEDSPMPWVWTKNNFRWVGSSAVLASGPGDPIKPPPPSAANPNPPPLEWKLLCLAAPAGANVWRGMSPPAIIQNIPGAIDRWLYLPSPCESVIAFTPNLSSSRQEPIIVVSLSTALTTSFRRNNVPVIVTCVATAPTIDTNQHTANGVKIDIGDGQTTSNVEVDDPDCTAIYTGVNTVADRVKASTLPSANLGVLAVGSANAGPLAAGAVKWVQVPNLNGWNNQGEPHWCLLAQAFTLDGTTIPRPWNGQAGMPPPFPISNENCAQRNIMISP